MDDIKDKDQFKPHLVEIEDRPVNPIGRAILWTILIFIVLLGLWLFFGKTDVVVSARAKVIPAGDVKIVQSFLTGSVKKIFVKEGDFVKKDDPLIEIDPEAEESSIQAKKRTLALLELEAAKIRSLIENKAFIPPSDIDAATVTLVTGMYETEKNLMREQQLQIDQQIKQIRQQIQATKINKNRLQELYKIGIQEQKELEEVLDLISKDKYNQLQKQNMNYQQEVSKLSHEILKLYEQLRELQKKKSLLKQSFYNKFYESLSQKEKEITAYKSEIDMIEFRKKKQIITSPVDGTIGKMAINTVGAVVTPAERLITIIPKDAPIQLKATVQNKDIGFIKVGMPVAIKIDTFNFQRFGLIDGNVTKISANAIEDERLGLVYEVFIDPKQTSLMVEGEKRYITPGMSATAELKVGERRIIELFIYPLIKYFGEGISVR